MDKEEDESSLLGERKIKIMATPISATPVLKGQDLVRLVKDLNRPDKNKEQRQKALNALIAISKDK